MKKATFIKNAFIMTATALLLRTIGMFFRVYMSNKIGAEGMGLYQLIFSIYVLGQHLCHLRHLYRRHPPGHRRAGHRYPRNR